MMKWRMLEIHNPYNISGLIHELIGIHGSLSETGRSWVNWDWTFLGPSSTDANWVASRQPLTPFIISTTPWTRIQKSHSKPTGKLGCGDLSKTA